MLGEIYDVLYNSKPIDTTIIKNIELFSENGESVSIVSAKYLNEPLFFTFKIDKDETQVSCCKVDILGYNQYNEDDNLVLVAVVDHYTAATHEDQYFYEFQLIKYALDGVNFLPIITPRRKKANKTDCYDDILDLYGFTLNALSFSSGKYRYDFSIGWDFPTYSVTCAHDSKDIQYGWPF